MAVVVIDGTNTEETACLRCYGEGGNAGGVGMRRIESFDTASGRQEGYIVDIFDHGGTDISYKMMTLGGRCFMVSGSRIKTMKYERMVEGGG